MRRRNSASRKPLLGHFKKAGSEPKKFVKEFRLPDGTTLEGAVDLNVNQFAAGDVVDVIGQSEGQRLPGRREEAQHGTASPRRTVR